MPLSSIASSPQVVPRRYTFILRGSTATGRVHCQDQISCAPLRLSSAFFSACLCPPNLLMPCQLVSLPMTNLRSLSICVSILYSANLWIGRIGTGWPYVWGCCYSILGRSSASRSTLDLVSAVGASNLRDLRTAQAALGLWEPGQSCYLGIDRDPAL